MILIGTIATLGVLSGAMLLHLLRRRYRDDLTAAYLAGFHDGRTAEAKAGRNAGRKAVMETMLSMN